MTDLNNETDIDPSFWSKTSLIQLGYGIWVNLTVVQIGMAFAFSAVIIPQLNSEDSFIQTTVTDNSWIVSCIFLSSLVGCMFCGFIMDRFGRRVVLIVCQIPLLIGWLYTGTARSAKDLIIGRTITGLGIGMVISAPRVYVAEITLPNMRGLIGAFPNIATAIGILTQAELGSILHWYIICYICAFFTASLLILNTFLPETPYFLLLKGTAENARSTLKRFRSRNFDIDTELNELNEFKQANNIRKLAVREQMQAVLKRSSCIPFAIVNTYIFFMQFSGVTIMIMWSIEMIKDSKSSVDPYLVNIILSLTRLCMAIVAAFMYFKFGRRPLAMISSIGLASMALPLGIFIKIADEPSMFPVFCYVGYMVFATLGYYSLPFLIMFELFPLQVRGLLGGMSISFYYLLVFGTNVTHQNVRMGLGHGNTMILFAISSYLCAIFIYFCLPETKYLTLSEIEEFFNKRRPTQTIRRLTIQSRQTSLYVNQSFMRPIEIAKTIEDNVKGAMSHMSIKPKSSTGGVTISDEKDDSKKDVKDKNKVDDRNVKKDKKDDAKDADETTQRDDEAGPSSRKKYLM